ncbi:resolvase [Vibrio cyclitrophicus]|uniref:recombinase family protein n=1 Tax=Vibrio cyclitrophicus TaxID=47951 RepID=UPI0007EED03C|nr:recombinase family protein [Vibrio cyclitrophicus]OBT02696.1 resolvase [Vibrio cyclitrophicus]
MALIGFARVSTQQQDLTAQIKKLEASGCSKIFKGKHSGKADTNKEALGQLLEYVREGDTVVVTKIDRLGRSLSQVLNTLDYLEQRGIKLLAIDQAVDTSKDDPMSKAMVQLLGMFAEMERNFIVSRTSEGKALSGNYGGRPFKLTEEQRREIKIKLTGGTSKVKLSKEYGVSRATILNIEKA